MIYLITIPLFAISFYTLSFAKFTWNKGNISGAIGVIILAIIAFAFPLAVAIYKM